MIKVNDTVLKQHTADRRRTLKGKVIEVKDYMALVKFESGRTYWCRLGNLIKVGN